MTNDRFSNDSVDELLQISITCNKEVFSKFFGVCRLVLDKVNILHSVIPRPHNSTRDEVFEKS